MKKRTSTRANATVPRMTVQRFRELLSLTKTKSAPGEDEITYGVMKLLSDTTLQILCDVINKCMAENLFPKAWKKAKVRMVPKPGRDCAVAGNNRPISLLSCLAKIYERHICDFLLKILDQKRFITKYQAGFTKGRSPQEHLYSGSILRCSGSL